MTTDITELAQSLKAAAENAIGAHERLSAYPYGEIIDISQHEGEQIDIDITDINEFHEEASPANILALVEALEKAQTKADVYDMLRDDYGLREKGVGLADFVDWQANRIAELESRTVKLPEPEQWDITQVLLCKKKVVAAIRDADIKVEAE
ncbi:Ead domain protein [Klebsiella pneumoniae]|uniref:ead/Ea22-like family protein n=1 Tax=Klebsiella pneumoniae TaxID=573 RepID=UPI001083F052|nr:ead/Ea22-like family protein [Klebsiella pneumoniae]VGB21794.1 Ead domain protein [Klebsiella pneumoniae]